MRVFEDNAPAATAVREGNTRRSLYGNACRGSQPRLLTLAVLLFLLSMPVAAQSYTTTISGPQTVYAGNNLYFNVEISVPATAFYTLNSVLLSGSSATFDAYCRAAPCGQNALGEYRDYGGAGYPMIVRLVIPATQPVGGYTLTVTTSYNGELATASRPINIVAPPVPITAPTSLPSIPIPQLLRWQSTMQTLGTKWCPAPDAVLSFGVESQVWYYDGARVFFQMSDYTKDSSYDACALSIARQYRDYVVANSGNIPGNRVFTRGLRMAYERTGDASFKDAVILLSTKNIWALRANAVRDSAIREASYIVNAFLDAEKLGAPRHPHLLRYIDYLLGHHDQIFVSKTYTIHQTFYDGLAAEALIDYYEFTGDARIPPTIKTMLDWMYNSGWNKATGKLVYNPDPLGPTCPNSCQVYMTDLINLIVPSFAWYWSITGEAIYQERGDEIWSHALDSDISYSGKVFSQNYKWSFDYLRWRKGSSTPCTYAVSPTSAAIGTNGGQLQFQESSPAGCPWTASSAASWAAISSVPAGPNPGTVAVTISPNSTTLQRLAELQIAGIPVKITQTACTFNVTPLVKQVGAQKGNIVINVVATGSSCAWAASAGTDWVVRTTPAALIGNGSAAYTISMNKSGAARKAMFSVAGQTVTIEQAGK
jgi:hypothetical protein